MLRAITQAVFLAVAFLVVCVSARAQYSANNQTNIISAVTSNWPGDYIVGYTNFADVLIVRSNGVLNVDPSGYLGYSAKGSNNEAIITGSGSVWNIAQDLYIGYTGAVNRLTISNGAAVVNWNNGYIGFNTNSSNNAVLVADSGSVWTNWNFLYIGNAGAGNRLTISTGALVAVVNFPAYIGYFASSSNNAVLVTGSNSVWNNSSDLQIGIYGSSNRLTISSGALVADTYGSIGNNTGSSNNTVLVIGSNSVWNNSGDLYIGRSGVGNRLTVSNGALVLSSHGYIGSDTNSSSGNAVLVTDSGSVWSNSSDLYIGRKGVGNRLTISNGAFVGNSVGYIGTYTNSNTNTVLVTGSGSVWSNASHLYVGYFGSSNQLRITEGGTTVASNLLISYSTSSNNVVAVLGGNLIVTNTGTSGLLTIQRGSLTINNGTVVADKLVATNGTKSILDFQSGTLSIGSSIISNGQQFTCGTNAGTATLQLRGGTNSFANGLLSSSNAVLTGTGWIMGTVSNAGSVTPGALSVSGNFVSLPGCILFINITAPNTCGQINVGNTVTFDGVLQIVLNGYTPRPGETFIPVTGTASSGYFAATNCPPLWPGVGWSIEYLNGVILTVVGRAVLTNYDLYSSYYNLGAGSETADANHNGIPNLMEYGLGNDPTGRVYRSPTTQSRSNGWFQIGFTRNTDASNIAYRVEAATYLPNGGNWSCILSNINNTGWLGPAPYSESPVTDGVVQVNVTDTTATATNRFLRLRVTRP